MGNGLSEEISAREEGAQLQMILLLSQKQEILEGPLSNHRLSIGHMNSIIVDLVERGWFEHEKKTD